MPRLNSNAKLNNFIELLNFAKISKGNSDAQISDDALNNLIRESYTDPLCRRVFPLVYQQLMELEESVSLQSDVLLLLKQTTYKSLISYTNQTRFIKKILPDLEKQNLTIYLLKSSALNGCVYSTTFIRLGVDIDMLTALDDGLKAEELLKTHAIKIPPPQLYPFEDLYESSWRSIDDQTVIIDLHQKLVNPALYNIPKTSVLNGSEPHPLYHSSNIRVLSPEMMVLHLALHMTNDNNYWHYNLLDIHELICQRQPDLYKMLSLSKKHDLGDALYYALEICACYLETPVDSKILRQFRPNKIRYYLAQWLIHKMLPTASRKKSTGHRLQQLSVQIVIMRNTRKSLLMIMSYLALKIKKLY